MRRGSILRPTAIAIAAVTLGTTELVAQVAEPTSPVSVTLDLATRAEIDSNSNLDVTSAGTSYSISETFSFGLKSETKAQLLDFTASGALEYSDTPGDGSGFDFDSPSLRLSYSRAAADSNVSVSANYRSSDVVNAIDDEDATATDVTADTGMLVVYGGSLGYAFGTNAPFGVSFDAAFTERDYSDTTDPDLVDSSSRSLGISANLRFSEVAQGTLSVSQINTSADNFAGTEKDSRSYSFAFSNELRRALTLNTTLGYREIETTEFSVASTTEGAFGSIDVDQGLRNGSIFGGLNFDASGDEDKVSLTFGRSMDLPDGSLSASLTATRGDVSGTKYLGSLDYSKMLPTGSITAGLSQSISTNVDDEDVKFSRLGLGYSQQVTAASDLNLSLNLSRTEDGGLGAADEKTRADFSAAYSYELTPDWDLSVGYAHRRFTETGAGTAKSDSVFLTLTRSLALGF